jgi:hypothetical protein
MRHTCSRSRWLAGLLSGALAVPQSAFVGAQSQTAKPTPAPQASAPAQPKPTTTPGSAATSKPATQPASTAQAKPAAQTTAEPPPGSNADTGWPRPVTLKTGTALWYQPQIETWKDQKYVIAWSAVSYQPTGATQPALGTIKIEGPTAVSVDERVVRMDLSITEYNFKTLAPDRVKALVAEMQDRPMHERVLDLDRVIAYVADSPLQVRDAEGMKADPPQIFWAPAPAILLNLDGDPIWSPIEGLDLRYVVNTNWDLFEHTTSKMFYVRYNTSWLQAQSIDGPWSAVSGKLPESFSKLPKNDNWKEVSEAVPGKKLSDKELPKVFVSTVPAELVVITGKPNYLKVQGASTLLWLSNTEADVFRMGLNGDYYFLVAGRWFKASSLDGPWTFATPTLPDDFKKIPVEHPRSRVLASIPGTPQATEAVLLASIPRTARVNKKELKAPDVVYQGGQPQVQEIKGSKGVQQVVNTDKDIVKVGDVYYMCFQGVWFMSKSANGPWEVASSIPQEIYTIPASSPVQHVTYVTVEEDNDDEWVTFAYVAAYTGVMIGWGCAMWGSGWYYPPYYGGGFYYPYPHTYGMGAWYNPHTGAYGRGYAAYGPYGGVGVGSSYNPRTGTYARGAAAYGPGGSRSAGQAYNPRTGTYAQTRQGSNVYGNWGSSSVQRGDDWAQTAHRTNYQTGRTTSGARTSEGGGAVRSSGVGGSTTVGRTQGGDIYAGRNGEVYRKNEGGGWEQGNGSGGWSPVDSAGARDQANTGARDRAGQTGTTQAGSGTGDRSAGSGGSGQVNQLERDSGARTQGNDRSTSRSNWESSGSSRSGAGSYGGGASRGGGGARSGGGGRRR